MGTALALGLVAGALGAQLIAVRGGTVHPVSGPPITEGVLLFEGATLVAVAADIEIPAAAEVVDATGKHVYPGFVHPASALGLVEIGSVPGTVDTREISDFNTDLRSERSFFFDSMTLPVALSGGITYAHPIVRGTLFSGSSAVLRTLGWTWEDMTVAAPVGQHLAFPELLPRRGWRGSETPEEAKKRREEALARLDEIMDAARAYRTARRAGDDGASPRPVVNPRFEALLPVLEGTLPLWIHAGERSQIAAALDWAEEQELSNLVLVAGGDVRHLAARLARQGVPVVLDGVSSLPRRPWEPWDTVFGAAAELERAGVHFAIGDGFGAANARNLPFEAAMAVAHGLSAEAALAAITLRPAEILGVADRIGSLDPGKEATFLITSGDPLDLRSRIEQTWVAGERADPGRDRQKRLWERYRNRPRPGTP